AALGPVLQLGLGGPAVAGLLDRALVLGPELVLEAAAAALAAGEERQQGQQHDHDEDGDEQACVHGLSFPRSPCSLSRSSQDANMRTGHGQPKRTPRGIPLGGGRGQGRGGLGGVAGGTGQPAGGGAGGGGGGGRGGRPL